MKLNCRWGATAILAILLSLNMASALADRHDDRRRDGGHDRGHDSHRQYDTRYSHNRYYPSIGVVFDILPSGYYEVPYGRDRFYFQGGVWYRSHGARFVVVTPPIGLGITVLPPYYSTVWVGGAPYYYADGVYYVYRPAQRTYVVVEPPRETEVLALPIETGQQFVYPKNGQDEQQQAKDKYECHRWAVTQTAYDPTQPSDNPPPQDVTRKRDDYDRATKACLEGRGYSVR